MIEKLYLVQIWKSSCKIKLDVNILKIKLLKKNVILNTVTSRQSYLCRRSLSDVKSRYSETFRPVISTRMSPVTTFMRGGRPPTPLGQEKPVPCIEQVQRTGSWTERGRVGGDVTGSEQTWKSKNEPKWITLTIVFLKAWQKTATKLISCWTVVTTRNIWYHVTDKP